MATSDRPPTRSQRARTARLDGTPTRIASFVYLVQDDEAETTLRGALIDQDPSVDWIRLANVEQAVNRDGRAEPDWVVADNTCVIPWGRILRLYEAPPPR